MKVCMAPKPFSDVDRPTVFLAGSIEMGAAEKWQDEVIKGLKGIGGTIYNPRRDDWDSSWEQKKDNPQFREQVTWELCCLECCDIIALYLSPGTKSPISLMELGIFSGKQLIVCCPEGFWRKGNVDIVCERLQIHQVDTLKELIKAVRDELLAMKSMVWRENQGRR